MTRRRDERGSTIPLLVGMAAALLMGLVLVVNASSAYLQRQSLNTMADAAALRGADLGSAGTYVDGGLDDRLLQERGAVKRVVEEYLQGIGAYQRYPDLVVDAWVNRERSVTVTLQAPVELPLTIPGSPRRPVVGASSTAAVTVRDP